MGDEVSDHYLANCQSEYTKWHIDSAKRSITAKIVYDDFSQHECEVNSRRNFTPTNIYKYPNICYIENEVGDNVIFREARSEEVPFFTFEATQLFGRKYANDLTNDIKTGKDLNVLASSRTLPKSTIIHIPEPNLIQALETLYTEELIPRLTPKYVVVGSDSNHLWTLRDMKTIAADVAITPTGMGAYMGKLASMGLMEVMDRQLIHYYKTHKNRLGNYDPDFMLHSRSEDVVNHRELVDIEKVISSRGKEFDMNLPIDLFMEELKKTRNVTRYHYNAQGVTPETFLERVMPKIKKATGICAAVNQP